MTSPSHSSDENFLESLGISLDEIRVTADADTHASVTGVYAQDSYFRLDVGEASIAEIPIDILDPNNPVGAIISPSHLDFLRHLELGRQNYKSLLGALAKRWWDTTNTFHFPWGEMTITPTDFSVISGIPFGTRPIELYDDWRTEVTPDRMMELIGIDLPRIVRSSSSTPDLSVSRHWLSLQAPDIYARHRQGELTATQTWAVEYFPYIRPELTHADLGLGLVPLAWRWYRANHRSVLCKKSLGDLRAFFDTCTVEQVEVGAMNARLQNLIEADPHFRRSEALSRRRIVLSHPVLRRYYLGERSGDYDEFCQMFLMQPIGSRLDNLPRSSPSQPLGTRSSRASGPSARTPRRRPTTRPSSSTPVEGPSRAGPSHSAGAFRVPQAILEATGPIHSGLANLHLPYSIPYYTPDGTSSLREFPKVFVSQSDDGADSRFWGFAPLPHGSTNGGYGLYPLVETIRSLDRAALGFDDWTVSPIILQADAEDEVGTGEEIVLAPRTGEIGQSLTARDDSEEVAPWRRQDT
ncbi:hypothetical protein JCGZ_17157 [Jatropha curcas]|uniref:Aminotransferase-like plant mobile domain-containing protein n=1 Tax=Jatropha curcas TaxID=180498 RepID=A0A067K2F2_JATCU|nr:hypothetical protein JCGZ_17157 [Jatropha curcas]